MVSHPTFCKQRWLQGLGRTDTSDQTDALCYCYGCSQHYNE